MSLRRLRVMTWSILAVGIAACASPTVAPSLTATVPEATSSPSSETLDVGVYIPAEDALGDSGGIFPTDLPLYSLDPNGSFWDDVVARFVYSGVYRLDASQSPVPDLADGPCAISSDLLVITCHLRAATFHDGTPLTAEDVAFTYQLLTSEGCRYRPLKPAASGASEAAQRPRFGRLPPCALSDMDRLASAKALDAQTVEFRLSEPDPAFITAVLPDVLIEPKARVEQAFAAFSERTKGTDPTALDAVASRLEKAISRDVAGACKVPDETILTKAEQALTGAGVRPRGRDAYAVGASSSFDACAYGEYLVRSMRDVADGLTYTGLDAIAAAYPVLDRPPLPIGSGPWRVASLEPGVGMRLDAFDGFHRGAPATKEVVVRLIRSTAEAVSAVKDGDADWLLDPFSSGAAVNEGIGDTPGVAWAEYPELAFRGLFYNLRPGRLFADPNLREAMERCIDKDETVAAATGGSGIPIYSPVSPSMWAFELDLPRPTRDVATARALIEASGWVLGTDGIYRKGDQRLSTEVPVLKGFPEAVRFMELLAYQVADCGIEIVPRPVTTDDLLQALAWPLTLPGADRPWDAIFAGWQMFPDPDYMSIFHSSAITTAEAPDANNYMGYSDPAGDRLMEEARATYDLRERARLLREDQLVLAKDRPVLFAWSDVLREPRSERLVSTDGSLPTNTSTWWWELEKLILQPSVP